MIWKYREVAHVCQGHVVSMTVGVRLALMRLPWTGARHRMSRSVIFVGILSNALVLRGSLAAGVWSNAQAAKGSEGV